MWGPGFVDEGQSDMLFSNPRDSLFSANLPYASALHPVPASLKSRHPVVLRREPRLVQRLRIHKILHPFHGHPDRRLSRRPAHPRRRGLRLKMVGVLRWPRSLCAPILDVSLRWVPRCVEGFATNGSAPRTVGRYLMRRRPPRCIRPRLNPHFKVFSESLQNLHSPFRRRDLDLVPLHNVHRPLP